MSDPAAAAPRYTRSPYIVASIAAAERLAALVAAADPPPALVEELHVEAAVASLRLDGSPITAPPPPRMARPLGPTDAPAPLPPAADHPAGGWAQALRVDGVADADLVALEYEGVRAALAADDLAEHVLADPEAALADLHRRLTEGLVDHDRQARPRRTSQAVHDGATGRVILRAPDPDQIPGRVALLAAWLQSVAAREHALVVSGILHLELVAIHPFEAANGRLARAAARLVLRIRGLDPHGLAGPEPILVADALGYHEEVAATQRRRDLTIWLERWAEAVVEGLRGAARRLGLVGGEVPGRAEAFVAGREAAAFTVADYRADVEVGPEDARADLEALLDAGLVRRLPGGRGLRFEAASGP